MSQARRYLRPLLFVTTVLVVSVFAFSAKSLTATGWRDQDKWEHIFSFIMLQGLGSWAMPRRTVLCAVCLLIFAAAIELVQSAMPGRTASSEDFAAGVAGIASALCLVAARRAVNKS